MGLSKPNKSASPVTHSEYCADMTNNLLFVDGATFEPYEVTTIVGMKHAYYHVPQDVHEDLKSTYRFASFIFFLIGYTTYLTKEFYKPTSMCISNNGIVIEDSNNNYCIVIEKSM